MINVNDNTILNPENVVIAEQKGSMYKLTLINGKTLYVNKDVYEDIIVYEPVSKEYVDSKLSAALKRVIVTTLPVEDIDTNTIYMVLDTESSETGNVYNEYMYINNAWELIGTTEARGPIYTPGDGISIDSNNAISADSTIARAADVQSTYLSKTASGQEVTSSVKFSGGLQTGRSTVSTDYHTYLDNSNGIVIQKTPNYLKILPSEIYMRPNSGYSYDFNLRLRNSVGFEIIYKFKNLPSAAMSDITKTVATLDDVNGYVVANPTLAGTEADLTGLEVNGTKYAIPQGGSGEIHLYQHLISIDFHNYNSNAIVATCNLSILNDSQEDITIQDIRDYLYLEDGGYIATTGYVHNGVDYETIYSITRLDDGSGDYYYNLDTTNGNTETFEDNTNKTDSDYQHWFELSNIKTIQVI